MGNPTQLFTRLELILALAAIALAAILLIWSPAGEPSHIKVHRVLATFDASKLEFERQRLLPEPRFGQLVTNVKLVDSPQSEGKDVIATDGLTGKVVRLTRSNSGDWNRVILNQDSELPCPAHSVQVDLDQDGDLDVVVPCIGTITPTSYRAGRVVWLENQNGSYITRTILTNVRRVTDAQPGDFDNDGDLDLVVAVFGGLQQGQLLWLENDGQQNFTDHELLNTSGAIHVPVQDFDGDGDLDFAAVISQEEEKVWAFENTGKGPENMKRHLVFSSWNFDFGTAGLVATDLDQDGDQDLLIPVGDNLELSDNAAQPWHGVILLENQGGWQFVQRKIASIGGVYGVSPGDLDGDGDTDLALVTMFNDWSQEQAASVLWLENDGQSNFHTWQISSEPIQLATVACGDINGDGQADIVTGSCHFRKPFHRFGGIDAFVNLRSKQ